MTDSIHKQLTQHEKDSTLLWAVNHLRLPKAAKWDFTDRKWQLDIIEDQSQQIVCRKPTQVGMSTVFLTKMLHFADLHICRTMITLPRQDDVSDMVNSRLLEIVNESPYLKQKMQGVDNVRTKQFGRSWLHFIEMSVPPRMIDVDWLLNDEVDLSNQEYLEHVISRLDASQYAYHHRISTPSIHGYGVDALYNLSDMKQWIVTCQYCLHEQWMEWPDNIAYKNGEAWYVCSRCHNKLHPEDIRDGRWQSTGNTNSEISGYQITQMMIPYISPFRMWTQFQTMNRKNFYNFRLGLPYTPVTGGINRKSILENCFITGHSKEGRAGDRGTYVLGCDQGDKLHISVGRVHNGKVEVVLLRVLSFVEGFDELSRIIERYNVKYAVIDALPNHHSAHKVISSFNRKLLLGYFTNIDVLYRINDDDAKISINKTDAYDHVMQCISDSTLQFYGKPDQLDEHLKEAIVHLCNMRRDIEEHYTRAGGVRQFHVWRAVGPDHYSDAILYMLMAYELTRTKNTRLNIVDLASLMEDEDFELLDTHLGEQVDVYEDGETTPVIGKRGNRKKLEANLRGLVEQKRLRNQGLMPDNPYKNLAAFVRNGGKVNGRYR